MTRVGCPGDGCSEAARMGCGRHGTAPGPGKEAELSRLQLSGPRRLAPAAWARREHTPAAESGWHAAQPGRAGAGGGAGPDWRQALAFDAANASPYAGGDQTVRAPKPPAPGRGRASPEADDRLGAGSPEPHGAWTSEEAMTPAFGEPQPVARSKPGRVAQQGPPKRALVPWVTSLNACGVCWASVVSRGATKPGFGRPWLWACWFQRAIMPATSGVA